MARFPSKPWIDSEFRIRTGWTLRNFDNSVAKDVLMKAKPFTPVSTSTDDLTPYPLREEYIG